MTEEEHACLLQRFKTLQPLDDPKIVPHAERTKAHVKIGETNPEQAEPRPKHMALVETSDAGIRAITCRRSGKLIEKATGQVSQ